MMEGENETFLDPVFSTFSYKDENKELIQIIENESEYAGRRLTTDTRVPGRINETRFYDFWKNYLKASDFVLSTLKEGYKFPFKEQPPASIACNNR